MKIPKISLCVILLLVVSCKSTVTPPGTPTPAPFVGSNAANGLSGSHQQSFYHLPEGSELYPYDWMKALHTANDQPFLQNPERFGLLSDPDNKDGLPIGLTLANRRGVPLGEMVGVNCAACHVSELQTQNITLRVDGGQNLFDLGGFYGELGADTKATVTSPEKLFAFLVRWWEQSHAEAAAPQPETTQASSKKLIPGEPDKRLPSETTQQVLSRYKSLDDLRKDGDLEKELADQISALVEKHKAAPTNAERMEIEPKAALASAAKKVAAKNPAATGVFAKAKSASERASSIQDTLKDVEEYIALLYSYVDFLTSLGGVSDVVSAGGYGRVDAFGGARNLLFPASPQKPTAPVCYPYLWGFKDFSFFHYAANTNSILERNIGQALGLGATYDNKFGTFATSVDIRNLTRLEDLASKITVPDWPFGAIDATKAANGKVLYQQHCAACHEKFQPAPPPPNVPSGSWTLNLYPVDEIGTDPNEAQNFPVPVKINGKDVPFPQAIQELIPKIEETYYKDFNISAAEQAEWNHGRLPAVWEGRLVYSARPMAGVWATPPYLHNGSVLTLYDLLLPASQRPTSFQVGTRKYDTVHLGYVNETDPQRSFKFDTTVAGNHKSGHEYGTTLSETDKMHLLEFLKSFKELPLPKQ
jgi:hypothetical protein